MSAWWQRLSLRDRSVLSIGSVIIGTLLAWSFLWYPLAQSRDALASECAKAEADLLWTRSISAELQRLRATGTSTGLDRAGRSLLALSDATAREAGLGGALQRIEPVGSARVNLWFEGVAFDAMVGWLEGLRRQFGVSVDEFAVERMPDTGTVNARIGVVEAPSG